MMQEKWDVLILGAGPGGCAAAEAAVMQGLKTALIDARRLPGGVCLHEGCIPSKALLQFAKSYQHMRTYHAQGLIRSLPEPASQTMEAWLHASIVHPLGEGLLAMLKRRGVGVFTGRAQFLSPKEIEVRGQETHVLKAEKVIVASGSEPITLAHLPKDPRIMTSSDALQCAKLSGRILVIGAGSIGCELASFYVAMGLEVTVCDLMDRAIFMADADVSAALVRGLEKAGVRFYWQARLQAIEALEVLQAEIVHGDEILRLSFDQCVLAMGRRPLTRDLGLESLGLALDPRQGGIKVNAFFESSLEGIYAIGDVAGGALAHQATWQGQQCVRSWKTDRSFMDPVIPWVVYSHPSVAWAGATERELQERSQAYQVLRVSWNTNGWARAAMLSEGMSKLLVDPRGKILGGSVVGEDAEHLISELVLALEMGAEVSDFAAMVHPHPSLSETWSEAAALWKD